MIISSSKSSAVMFVTVAGLSAEILLSSRRLSEPAKKRLRMTLLRLIRLMSRVVEGDKTIVRRSAPVKIYYLK